MKSIPQHFQFWPATLKDVIRIRGLLPVGMGYESVHGHMQLIIRTTQLNSLPNGYLNVIHMYQIEL